MPPKLTCSTDKPRQRLDPTEFAYVGRSRCGHVNFIAVEPHPGDREERESLYDDLRGFFVSGGTVERFVRADIPPLDLCDCPREAR